MFCPRCEQIYYPTNLEAGNTDGAYFGTTFPHLLLLQYPDLIPDTTNTRMTYVPRVFGFAVNKEHPDSPFAKAKAKGKAKAAKAKAKAKAEAKALKASRKEKSRRGAATVDEAASFDRDHGGGGAAAAAAGAATFAEGAPTTTGGGTEARAGPTALAERQRPRGTAKRRR